MKRAGLKFQPTDHQLNIPDVDDGIFKPDLFKDVSAVNCA